MRENRPLEVARSAVTAVATPVTVEVPADFRHHQIGIQFFDDAAGGQANLVTPGAGTVAIVSQTVANEGVDEAHASSPMAGTAPVTLDLTGHIKKVTATPSGITTATHYQLVVTSSRD